MSERRRKTKPELPRGPELESRIASTRRVGPLTLAHNGLRSVFRFFALAVVRDMRIASIEGRTELWMLSRPGEQRRRT